MQGNSENQLITEEGDEPDILSVANVFRADYEDVPQMDKMFTSHTAKMFNTSGSYRCVHQCAGSHVIKDRRGKIVAAICLADSPNIPGIPSDDWMSWISRLYGIKDTNSFNTFWVHLALVEDKYAETFLVPLARCIFEEYNRKHYLFFVVPPGCSELFKWLDAHSTKILPIDVNDEDRVQTLRLLVNQDFVTNYKIRRAVEEDNDDLVPLIDASSNRLKSIYGEFYIAEIVTRHPAAGRQIIVAEYRGLAVSVLCLNKNVNYDELNEAFDLHVFLGLYKPGTSTYFTDPKRSDSCLSMGEYKNVDLGKISGILVKHKQKEEDVVDLEFPDYGEIPPLITLRDVDELSLDLSLHESRRNMSKEDIPLGSALDLSWDEEEDTLESSAITEDTSCVEQSESSVNKGQENAFAIEIAAADSMHEVSLCLLLEAAFECFPEKDYCIITLPAEQMCFPLLDFFIRVTPRRKCFHPHELYITHKSMMNTVSIRRARLEDEAYIKTFSMCVRNPGTLVEKFYKDVNNPESSLITFLLISGNATTEPIGVVMVNQLDDLDFIKQRYAIHIWTNMMSEKNNDVGVIEYFCMSPLFRRHSKFFLREIHRMSGYLTLFYAINRFDSTPSRTRPLPSILGDVFPVPARKNQQTEGRMKMQKCENDPFALYVSTARLTSIPRVEINNRIVVVGSSYTSIAFLKGLIFSNYRQRVATFNNITLVSMHGLCHAKPPNKMRDMLRMSTSDIDFEYMEKLNLRCYISIIKGTLTGINRKEKMININKKYTIPYDKLFLMCGLQYGVPRKENVKDYLKMTLPENLFTINTETDASEALLKIKDLSIQNRNQQYNILVYGFTLETYCCVAALLEYGVPPQYISLVEPYPPERDGELHHDFIFQDGDVYEMVIDSMRKINVNMCTGYKLLDWTVAEDGIITVKLAGALRYMEMEVLAGFVYPEKSVNIKAFEAIYESGLVFDGRLVISPNCQTNDHHIYAAGPLTKYSRRFYADNLCHKYFNSEEIGEKLGKTIRATLLPYKEETPEMCTLSKKCWAKGDKLVPVYTKPLVTYCVLPGGIHYLHVCKPGVTVPLETAMSDDDYGSVLLTGNCRQLQQQGYFRIHLSTNNLVETITCLSITPFNYKKLILLWGKHEAMLNNLVKRFEVMHITDLFQYFEKPWCSAIFHDDFPLFENEMMKVLYSASEAYGDSPFEDLLRYYQENDFKPLNNETKMMVEERFRDSPYEDMLANRLLDFIKDNLHTLDMYAHPFVIHYILARYEESTLFNLI